MKAERRSEEMDKKKDSGLREEERDLATLLADPLSSLVSRSCRSHLNLDELMARSSDPFITQQPSCSQLKHEATTLLNVLHLCTSTANMEISAVVTCTFSSLESVNMFLRYTHAT